jgi:hypothetical protein
MRLIARAVLALAVALVPASASAGDKFGRGDQPGFLPRDFRAPLPPIPPLAPFPRSPFRHFPDRFQGDAKPHDHDHDKRGHRHFHGPIVIFPAPVIVPRSIDCWAPGYWTHRWVPATVTHYVWVNGHWTADGQWVDGFYAPAWTGGYWEPVWNPGYWAC